MSTRKAIAHRSIMVCGLLLSVSALPFSLKACHAGMIIILIGWLFEGEWSQKLHCIRRSVFLQLMLAMCFLLMIGLTYSEDLAAGFFNVEKKLFFFLVPLALATTCVRLSKNEIKIIFFTFLMACFIGSVICIANAWHQANLFTAGEGGIDPYFATAAYKNLHPFDSDYWLIFSYISLSEGIQLHPTYFSLYLVFCIIFLFHELPHVQSSRVKILMWTLLVYFALFVIFLASRIMILGLSVIFITVLIHSLIKKEKSAAAVTVAIVLIFSCLLFVNPVSRYRNLQEINFSTFDIKPDHVYDNAAQIRVSLWWLAIQSLEPSGLIWGAGTGDVKRIMEETSGHYNITNVLGSFDPHNQFLSTLLAHGLLGFLLLVVFLGLPAYFAWVQKDYFFLGSSFLFFLLCCTESALELQKGIGFYTLFFSVLAFQRHSFQTITIHSSALVRAAN